MMTSSQQRRGRYRSYEKEERRKEKEKGELEGEKLGYEGKREGSWVRGGREGGRKSKSVNILEK